MIALDDYLAIFGRATNTAAAFEFLAQLRQVVVGADKSRHQRNLFSSTCVTVYSYRQLLLRWFQCLNRNQETPCQ